MVALKFDFRDLFRTTRVAFSFQRIWIQFLGLISGYGIFLILAYAGAALSGGNLTTLWIRYGLVPNLASLYLAWYGWILLGLGVFILVAAWLVTSTAVSRATYMNLKGNTFYTWKEAFRFAFKKKAISVIATPVAILGIAFFTGLGGVVVGLISRIPYVGEIGVSLFTLVWFLASFFIVFVLAACAVSLLITPAVLATTDDDAFEGIFQSFSTLFSQPWRLVIYELLVGALSVAGFLIFAFFCKLSWRVMTTLLIWGMGEDYANISYQAAYHLQTWVYPAVIWVKSSLGSCASIFFSHHFVALKLSAILQVSSVITGVFIALISAYVFSYLLASFNVGNALIFLVLKKKKDDENLLERKDKEEEEPEEEKTPETIEAEAAPSDTKKKDDAGAKKKKAAPKKKTTKTTTAAKTTKASKPTRAKKA